MDQPVFLALAPVVLLVAAGWVAARRSWLTAAGVTELSNLVFTLLAPAMLFRAMSRVRVQTLDFTPAVLYFAACALLATAALAWRGLSRRTVVRVLTACFGNTVMIGIPLITLAFGEAGLVHLLMLISVHSLVLLTAATVLFELAVMREARARGELPPRLAPTLLMGLRNAIVHPVPLPILLGLAFAQTGWRLPAVVDQPLGLLGSAFGPLALVLVGASLANTRIGEQLRAALWLSAAKNLLLPALLALLYLATSARGLAAAVMITTAALPVGANAFLFAQRYAVDEDLTTASMAVSTLLALFTLPLVMLLVRGGML